MCFINRKPRFLDVIILGVDPKSCHKHTYSYELTAHNRYPPFGKTSRATSTNAKLVLKRTSPMRHMRSVTVRIPSVLTSNSYGVQWAAYLVRKSWICDQCYRPRTIDLPSNGITAANTFHGGSLKNIGIYHRNKLAGTTFTRYASSEGYTPGSTSNELPSQEERRRSSISRRLSIVMDHVQSNIFIAGQRLNDLTGYSGIEVLKKDIEQQGLLKLDMRKCLAEREQSFWCKTHV